MRSLASADLRGECGYGPAEIVVSPEVARAEAGKVVGGVKVRGEALGATPQRSSSSGLVARIDTSCLHHGRTLIK